MDVVSGVQSYVARAFGQIWRFAVVGLLTLGINISCFAALYDLMDADYRVAATLAYFVTIACHFFLNKTFTFGAASHKLHRSAPRYGLMLGLNYLITLSAYWAAVEVFGQSPYFGLLGSVIGTSMSSFFLMKHFVFRMDPAT